MCNKISSMTIYYDFLDFDTVYFYVLKIFLIFFKKLIFWVFLYYFDVLMSKIIF